MNLHNLMQSAAMLATMTALLAVIGFILAGRDGLLITAVFVFAFLMFGRRASKSWMLMAIGAVKLRPDQAPAIHAILAELSRRAGLDRVPDVYLMDAEQMLGFSTGTSQDDAAVVLSGPLVQGLNARELAGVLAHEVSHIASGDLAVMGLADMITRMTRTLSMIGLILIVFNIPLSSTAGGYIPWGALLLLMMAPLLSFLLQMGLSRVREFEADHGAVDICGDPEALAVALEKLEIQGRSLLQHAYFPHRPGTEPSLLRSHPVTQERVSRILRQSPAMGPLPIELIGEQHGYPREWSRPFGLPIRWLLRWWR
ncbi:zinc metalloprotease HtpX [Magnetovibrio sp.]|uniref:zinc metalloprotease HtpX n=1 Tax=Magnetovibrio sp. TaxID=2024836 RepID=UPI002F95ED23